MLQQYGIDLDYIRFWSNQKGSPFKSWVEYEELRYGGSILNMQ